MSTVARILLGLLLGLVLGVLLIGLGAVRAAVFIGTGGQVEPLSADDIRAVVYAIGGFSVAGGAFGALSQRTRTQPGFYGVCALGGMILMSALALSRQGRRPLHGVLPWLAVLLGGAIIGMAGGYGWRRHD